MNIDDKIYVAGHQGMLGSAVVRLLERRGCRRLLLLPRQSLDLLDAKAVADFFRREKPDTVILAAARVGGIQANIDHPGDFLYENLVIQNNVIHQACFNDVKKFCFLGSSCIYPRAAPQPMKEEYLLTGPLEPTNEGYALAKIAGLKLVELYRKQHGFRGISLMPCNLYGTNDSFDPRNSHVLSALVKKFVDAIHEGQRSVTLWGTGKARREFLHVDDAAEAIFFLLEHYDSAAPINVGSGVDISIKDLAQLIARKVGFKGEIVWDATKPDGMPRKCLDVSRLCALGFTPRIDLAEGVEQAVHEYSDLRNSTYL